MTKKKTNYYSLKNILSKNADYNLIIGERSNGKTYALLEYALKLWVESGYTKQAAYIRRFSEDIMGKRAEGLCNGIVSTNAVYKITKGEYSNVKYYSGKYYLCNYDDRMKKFIPQGKPFLYNFSLSASEHDKSTSYPNIDTIIFDEFITRRFYLVEEFTIFMNTLSTIIRDRKNIKIFMLGNTVNKYAPYFAEMGLNRVKYQEQGTIDLYSYGESGLTVAVEYCGESNKHKPSNKYFAFDNPKLNMIKHGQWELDIYPHLPEGYKIKQVDVVFSFYILFDGNTFQADVVEDGQSNFIFIHDKTTPIKNPDESIIYSLDLHPNYNIRKNIFASYDRIDGRIAYFFHNNKVFYQNNEIGECIRNYIKAAATSMIG